MANFKQENVKHELEENLLRNGFNRNEVEKITYRNFCEKILNKLNS